MSHTAQTTYYGLPIYEDKAGNQPTYLGDWNEAMRTLDSSLNAVAGQSSGVVTTANQALSTAQQAQQTANAANTVANAAQQTASGLSDAVETAQQTAEAANTAAGTAQSTAESANSAAQQASTTASNALAVASKASTKISAVSKIFIGSPTFTSSEGEFVTISGSTIKSALGVSNTTGKTLVVSVCNGDIAAAPNLSINTIAINQSSWDVRVYLGARVSSAIRLNYMAMYV